MRESQVTDEGTLYQREHEQWTEVMLTRPPTSRQPSYPVFLNASTRNLISSDNHTVVVHVTYNNGAPRGDFTSSSSSSSSSNESNIDTAINSTTAVSYEQLSREFYQSYDPSTGLHTGAVLGGILVWLVLYVIYRTKVRKCVIHLAKKICSRKDEETEPDVCDSEKESSAVGNTTMIRTLVNPSIVIETSPPVSPATLDQYNNPGEQECFSPFSLPRAGIHDEGTIFQFPYPNQSMPQQHFDHYHLSSFPEQQEELHLPKSEMDIASATAKWVHNMPLASRSQQDFACLTLSMQNHGLLAMNKHCSCPRVWPRSPKPLPLLELPSSWNNSLPVLSNSLSSQILSAYEAVSDKDIKDIINAKRKRKKDKRNRSKDFNGECASLIEENSSSHRHGHAGLNHRRNRHNRNNKNIKALPDLTITIPNIKENIPVSSSSVLTHSPVPIPFTPTIMIQNSKPTQRRPRDYDSTTSVSSDSSADLLLAQSQAPPIHIIKPASSPRLLSPHHLSPVYHSPKRTMSPNVFSWSREDIRRYEEDKHRSGSASPRFCNMDHHQCSFKYHKRGNNSNNKKPCANSKDRVSHRPCKLVDRSLSDTSRQESLAHHHRSLSDYNCHAVLFNTPSPFGQPYHRSKSTEIPIAVNIQTEDNNPNGSVESNINTIGNFPYSQTQYLLQVPDTGNLLRPGTPDAGGAIKYQVGTANNGNQPSMRHCVHSDSNIAYYAAECFPSVLNIDTTSVRRHSAFVPLSGDINLSFCVDNTVRASSSFGSSGSYTSPHHHPHLPHRHNSHHFGLCHHQSSEHHRHHSLSMLGLDDSGNSQHKMACLAQPHSNLNRSFSAVVMETKL